MRLWLRRSMPGATQIAATARSVTQTITMRKWFRLVLFGSLLSLAGAMPPVSTAQESADPELFELEVEYVYGRNRGPKMGYTKPEVFDPINDKLYRAGYKNYRPIGVPVELKKVDAMTRVKTMGAIIACADGWFWPFSRTARNNEPAGLEVEILQEIAKKHAWIVEMVWVNLATRFGPGASNTA